MAHDVFICHSSKDKVIADAICAKLEQNGIRCWIAPRDVIPGSDFAESIVAAIHASKVTVFVFSANSNVSPHVSHELERSVSLGLPILPFRVDDVVPSPALEYFISSAHWLDALTPPMEQHVDRLVSTVAVLLDREVAQPGVPALSGGPPARRSSRKWIAAGAGALAVLAAVVAGLVVTLGGGSDRPGVAGTPGAGSSPTTGAATSFAEDFTGTLDPGWTWVDEDAGAWSVSPQGWLRIEAREGPPYTNVLLREAPQGDFSVKIRLRFPETPTGFAGVVLVGDDLESRLQFGWSDKTIEVKEYDNGNIAFEAVIDEGQFPVAKDRDIQLILTMRDGHYQVRFYNSEVSDYWDLGDPREPESVFTRAGLIAYRTSGPADTFAEFDRFQLY